MATLYIQPLKREGRCEASFSCVYRGTLYALGHYVRARWHRRTPYNYCPTHAFAAQLRERNVTNLTRSFYGPPAAGRVYPLHFTAVAARSGCSVPDFLLWDYRARGSNGWRGKACSRHWLPCYRRDRGVALVYTTDRYSILHTRSGLTLASFPTFDEVMRAYSACLESSWDFTIRARTLKASSRFRSFCYNELHNTDAGEPTVTLTRHGGWING